MDIYKRYKLPINVFLFVEAVVLILVFLLLVRNHPYAAAALTTANFCMIFSFAYMLYEIDKKHKVYMTESEQLKAANAELLELQSGEEAINQILKATIQSMEIERFLDIGMQKLMDLTESNWIAFYLVNKSINKLEIKSSLGFSQKIYKQFDLTLGEGFVGAAALDGKIKIISDIPDDTIYYSYTVLGKMKPKSLLVVPILNGKNETESVVVLGSMYGYNEDHVATMERLKDYVAVATLNNNYYNTTQRLSKEIRFQNQLIQDLNDEQESKITEKTDFLKNIYNSLKDYAVMAIDAEYNVIYANSCAERIFGNIKGTNIEMLTTTEFMLSKLKKSLNFALNNGAALESLEILDKDASLSLMEIQMYAIYNKNKASAGVALLIKDSASVKVKSAKSKENRALIITDDNGIIESANKATETLINRKSDELVGIKVSEFFEDKNLIDKLLSDVKANGRDAEMLCQLKGSDKNVTVKVNPIASGKNTRKLFIYI